MLQRNPLLRVGLLNSLEWRELFLLAATLSPLPFPMGTPPICRSVQKAERGGMVRSVANCPVVVGAERPATEPTPSPPPLFLEVINSIGLYSIGPKESLPLSDRNKYTDEYAFPSWTNLLPHTAMEL